MKRIFGILFLNVLAFVALLGSILVIGAIVQDVDGQISLKTEKRSRLEVYKDTPWAARHFQEFRSLKSSYEDFIGWRRQPFSGETITIDEEGYRFTPWPAGKPSEQVIHVYGGSTVWGTGADDASTIPARLSEITGKRAFNFGESGYVAHQSLNLLMKNFALGQKPEFVIFYDGVNDVSLKCRSEISFFGTAQEQRLKTLTTESRVLRLIVTGLGLSSFTSVTSPYDCDTNPQKANHIADMLVLDWLAAKQLSEVQGARFIGILQPVSYLGRPNAGYLVQDEQLKKQFEIVYPLFRRKLAERNISYTDLSAIFDDGPQVYIDFCHVTPEGNSIVASRISQIMGQFN
jgi:hypothetical protein